MTHYPELLTLVVSRKIYKDVTIQIQNNTEYIFRTPNCCLRYFKPTQYTITWKPFQSIYALLLHLGTNRKLCVFSVSAQTAIKCQWAQLLQDCPKVPKLPKVHKLDNYYHRFFWDTLLITLTTSSKKGQTGQTGQAGKAGQTGETGETGETGHTRQTRQKRQTQQTRQTRQTGQTGQTGQTFQLDFPGKLWLASSAILAMFFVGVDQMFFPYIH